MQYPPCPRSLLHYGPSRHPHKLESSNRMGTPASKGGPLRVCDAMGPHDTGRMEREVDMTQGTEQSQDQQQPDPLQQLTQALQEIRQVQNFLELNKPGSMQAIKMQREAG